jgi:hydroxymethylpyrimidine pyrophosphatase-like HAD family hydrolase
MKTETIENPQNTVCDQGHLNCTPDQSHPDHTHHPQEGVSWQNIYKELIPSNEILNEISDKPDQKLYFNLLPQDQTGPVCYSCGVQYIKPEDVEIKGTLKAVIVSANYKKAIVTCPHCGAPLMVEFSSNEIKEGKKSAEYPLVEKLQSEVLLRVHIIDTLFSPQKSHLVPSVIQIRNNKPQKTLQIVPLKYFAQIPEQNKAKLEKNYLEVITRDSIIAQLLRNKEQITTQKLKQVPKVSSMPCVPLLDNLGITFENINQDFYKSFRSMLFLDIDGTSTTSKKELIPEFKHLYTKINPLLFKVLRILEQKKLMKTIVSSGRPLEFLFFYTKDAGLHPTVIASNGNGVCYDIVHKYPFDTSLYTQKGEHKEFIRSLLSVIRAKYNMQCVEALANTTANTQIMVLKQFSPEPSVLEQLLNTDVTTSSMLHQLNPNYRITVTRCEGLTNHVSINCYSKGTTAQKLIEKSGFDKSYTINVGNQENDITLAKTVDYSCSVANGTAQYKKECSYVSQKEEHLGTLDCIREFLSIKNILNKEQFEQIVKSAKQIIQTEIA